MEKKKTQRKNKYIRMKDANTGKEQILNTELIYTMDENGELIGMKPLTEEELRR